MKSIYVKKDTRIYKVSVSEGATLIEEHGWTKSSKEEFKQQRLADKATPVPAKYTVSKAKVITSHNNKGRFAYNIIENKEKSTAIMSDGIIIGHTSTNHTGYETRRQDRFKSLANKSCHQEGKPVTTVIEKPVKQSPPAKNPNKVKTWKNPIKDIKQVKLSLPAILERDSFTYKGKTLDFVIDIPEDTCYAPEGTLVSVLQKQRINSKLAEIRNGFARKVEEELQERFVKIHNAQVLYGLDLSNKTDGEINAVINTLKSVIGEIVYDNNNKLNYTILTIIAGKVTMVGGKIFSVKTLFTPRFTITSFDENTATNLQKIFA